MLLLTHQQRLAEATFWGRKSSVSTLWPSTGKIMRAYVRPEAEISRNMRNGQEIQRSEGETKLVPLVPKVKGK